MPIFVIILIYAVFALVSSAAKSRQSQGEKPSAAPARSRKPLAGISGAAPKASARMENRPSEPSAPAAVSHSFDYQGSLGGNDTEGFDPCHDDPAAVPRGSLSAAIPEGTDPCHDDWQPLKPDQPAGAPAGAGGLNLNWTGDDLVKGFVLGEILRRKVS